ncbi:MAG: DUF1080 domain-containing protein [Pirellulaceae bacterium]
MTPRVCLMVAIHFMAFGSARNVQADEKQEKADWESLFAGESGDLEKWMPDVRPARRAPRGAWLVKEAELTMEKNAGYLWTKEKYADFVLELEFKLPPKANSGVFFRTRPEDPVQGGFEIQLLDDLGYAGRNLGKHANGALYDCVAPSKQVSKPAGEWQSLRICARDRLIRVTLNGEAIVEADLNRWTEAGKNPDGTKNKFKTAYTNMPRTGHIGLQDHGSPLYFRNIRVKRLN